MSPKTKISKESIIKTAFEIGEKQGIKGITARSIAQKLNCSVAPIYVNFSTIDELIKVVIDEVYQKSKQILEKQKGTDVFYNIGIASIIFAKKYPTYFKELTLYGHHNQQPGKEMDQYLITQLSKEESFKNWNENQIHNLLLKIKALQLGLSLMTANRQIDMKQAESLLIDAGKNFIVE